MRSKVPLSELREQTELERVMARSTERPQLLFKHSLTCPVSGAAHRAFHQYLEGEPDSNVEYSWLAVQQARPLSNAVAEELGIRHESPQALLIWQREAVWNASHWQISVQSLDQAMRSAASAAS